MCMRMWTADTSYVAAELYSKKRTTSLCSVVKKENHLALLGGWRNMIFVKQISCRYWRANFINQYASVISYSLTGIIQIGGSSRGGTCFSTIWRDCSNSDVIALVTSSWLRECPSNNIFVATPLNSEGWLFNQSFPGILIPGGGIEFQGPGIWFQVLEI